MKTKHIIFIVILMMIFVFLGTNKVNATNGPSDLYAFIRFSTQEEFVTIYNSFGEENQTIEGVSYDKDSNTLTLTNYTKDYYLSTNMMGDDFKLKLVGENSLSGITVWGDGHGGSLNIVGEGTLTVNEKKEYDSAIIFYAEDSNSVLTIEKTANVNLYAKDKIIYIDATTEGSLSKAIVLKNGQDISKNIEKDNYKHQEYLSGICYEEEYHNDYTIYTKDGKKYGFSEWDEKFHVTSSPIVYDEVTERHFVDRSFTLNPEIYNYNFDFDSIDEVLAAGYVATDEQVTTTSAFGMEAVYSAYLDANGKKYIVQNYYYNGEQTHKVYEILDRTMTLSDGNQYHFWSLTNDVQFESLTESIVAEDSLFNYAVNLTELKVVAGEPTKQEEPKAEEPKTTDETKTEEINPAEEQKNEEMKQPETITVKVEAEDNNNETTSAKVEVEKLISSLISLENGTVDGIDENLASKIREKVNNGETIKVDVVTSDIKAEDVAEDAEKVNTKISGTSKKIAAYFDIDVLVKTATESLGNVTNLKDKITLEVKLPSNLPALKTGYQRSYKVIRVHNGVAEELDTKLSGDKVVFSSDRFSTYALTYEDTKITKNPETGDNIIPYIGLLIVSMVAFGVSMKKRK